MNSESWKYNTGPLEERVTLDDVRSVVRTMRELGILEWGGIVLDPTWQPPPEKRKPRSPAEHAKITERWATYRLAYEEALIDGTELPDPPPEPEEDL